MAVHHHHHCDHKHDSQRNIGIAFATNLSFGILEFVGGIFAGSLAILADAVHDLGDSLTLALAWYLERLSVRAGDGKFTYGYRRFSLLSSIISAIVIIGGSLVVLVLTLQRFQEPREPNEPAMMVFALIGIVANGFAALRLSSGKTQNERILVWHLLEDLLGWGVVLIGSIVIYFTGWSWVDPAMAVGISLFIIWNVMKQLRYSLFLFLQGSPHDFDQTKFQKEVEDLQGVVDLHECHVWSLDGVNNILSCHITTTPLLSSSEILALKEQIRKIVATYGQFHITIEVEEQGHPCSDRCN